MRLAIMLPAAGLLLGASLVFAQALQGPRAPEAAPTFQLDKKGKRDTLNFNISLAPITNANLKFSQFQGRKLLIYYFSAKCPHCQHSVPHVQRLADELAPKGYSAVSIAIKYNTEDDIRGFIRDFGVRMPILQDDHRHFGDNYGVGTIPVVYLVNEKGEYIRYSNFNYDATPGQIRAAALSWVKK